MPIPEIFTCWLQPRRIDVGFLDDVQAPTGSPFLLPGAVPVTSPPSAAELDALRALPAGVPA